MSEVLVIIRFPLFINCTFIFILLERIIPQISVDSHLESDYDVCNLTKRRRLMTEQNRLRKFKLIDREGFLNNNWCNEYVLNEHLIDGYISGFENIVGDICDSTGNEVFIYGDELIEYFEEVFEVAKDDNDNKTFIYGGEEYLVVAPHPTQEDHTIVIKTSDNYIDVFSNALVEKLMKPKSWQETLAEEFDLDYNALVSVFTTR